MHTTRISLIQKLGAGEAQAWNELDRVYRPLIHGWLRRYHLQPSDADDLTQEVLTVLVRGVADFEHNGRVGAFRNWLRTTTVNLARNYLRRKNQFQAGGGADAFQEMLDQLEDPQSRVSQEFEWEHDRAVVRRLLEQLASQFEAVTIDIFRMHVVDGVGVQETAQKLGVGVASVHTAKSRVLRRLRQDAAEIIDNIYLR